MAGPFPDNRTEIVEFILLGFAGLEDLQAPLFCFFLLIYFVTVVGNSLIILLVVTYHHVHPPSMYFFLGNLAFLEICYSSSILPMMLSNLIYGGRKSITEIGCMLQYYFFAIFGVAECCLLGAMSYDRYVAICKPLHYIKLMNGRICFQFIVESWIHGLLVMSIILYILHTLKFCGPTEIDHFFCELNLILKVACSDTHFIELATTLLSIPCILLPFLLTLASYIFIISTVMRMSSVNGRKKAFSTCSSHLMVVSIFYSTLIIVYMLPKTDGLREINKVLSVFYTILTPLLNPLIYSLRNREIIETLKKAVAKLCATERIHHCNLK